MFLFSPFGDIFFGLCTVRQETSFTKIVWNFIPCYRKSACMAQQNPAQITLKQQQFKKTLPFGGGLSVDKCKTGGLSSVHSVRLKLRS